MLRTVEQPIHVLLLVLIIHREAHDFGNSRILVRFLHMLPVHTPVLHILACLKVDHGSGSSSLDSQYVILCKWISTDYHSSIRYLVEEKSSIDASVLPLDSSVYDKYFIVSLVCASSSTKLSSVEKWILEFKDSMGLSFINYVLRTKLLE